MRVKPLTAIIIILLLTQLIGFALAQQQGQSTFWSKVMDKITWPARKYIEFTIGSIINGLTYNPTLFCPPTAASCEVTAGMDVLISKWIGY